MDTKAVARKIREAIFDQAEQDGRVLHGDSIDATIERVLAAVASNATPEWHQPVELPPMRNAAARMAAFMAAHEYYRPIVQGGTTLVAYQYSASSEPPLAYEWADDGDIWVDWTLPDHG